MTNVPLELDTHFRAAAAEERLLDVAYDLVESPLGDLFVGVSDRGLCVISYEADPDAEVNLEISATNVDEATTVPPLAQSNRGSKRKRLSLSRDTTLGSSRNSSPAPSLFTEASTESSTESTAGLNCPADIGTQRARFFNLSQEGPIVMGDEEFQRYWPFVRNIYTKKDTRGNKTRYLCLFNQKKARESVSTGKRIKVSIQQLSFLHSSLTLQ